MKIVFLLPELSIGGLQWHLVRLCNELVRTGRFNITVIMTGTRDDLAHALSKPIKVVKLSGRGRDIRTWIQCYKVLEIERADFVVGWSLYPSVMACAFKLIGLKSKVVVTELNYPPLAYGFGSRKLSIPEALCAVLFPHADVITANSEHSLQFMSKYSRKARFERIYNPVEVLPDQDPEQSMPASWLNSDFKIVAVGRILNRHKGFDVLVRAAAQLKGNLTNFAVLIVGDGPDRVKLETQIQDAGLTQHVFLSGWSSNPAPIVAASDVFVLPSNFEGFPNALVEAMMIGKVVVAADCFTGPNEVVTCGRSGYLFPVGDHRKLAQDLLKVYSTSANDRIRMGREAQKATEAFKLRNATSQYVSAVLETPSCKS